MLKNVLTSLRTEWTTVITADDKRKIFS